MKVHSWENHQTSSNKMVYVPAGHVFHYRMFFSCRNGGIRATRIGKMLRWENILNN